VQKLLFSGAVPVLTALIAATGPASAQLAVGIATDRSVYLTFEAVRATVTIRNYTGNALIFGPGRQTGSISLTATGEGGLRRRSAQVTDVVGDLVLAPGETRDLAIILNNLIDISSDGEYELYVQAGHPRLNRDFRSSLVRMHVRDGTPVWRRRIGLPARDGAHSIPERDVSVVALHDGGVGVYCLRIEDDSHVYGTVRLGRRISGAEPGIDIDAVSNIHILLRIRSRVYSYQVFGPHGKLKQEKLLALDEGTPQLLRDPSTGRVGVVGGRPAIEGLDYVDADSRRGGPR